LKSLRDTETVVPDIIEGNETQDVVQQFFWEIVHHASCVL